RRGRGSRPECPSGDRMFCAPAESRRNGRTVPRRPHGAQRTVRLGRSQHRCYEPRVTGRLEPGTFRLNGCVPGTVLAKRCVARTDSREQVLETSGDAVINAISRGLGCEMIEESGGIARADVPTAADSSDFLVFRDLAMMSTAIKYDLTDKAEKTRSVRDLSRLFFQVGSILDVDLFVEAGAKDAASSRRARRRINPNRIVAFEANPYVYERFAEANSGDVGVEYEHLALSQEPGSVTFNVTCSRDGTPQANGQASLLK